MLDNGGFIKVVCFDGEFAKKEFKIKRQNKQQQQQKRIKTKRMTE